MIYLDNNATTPIDPVVSEKLSWFAKNYFGNPSSIYPIGLEVKEMINTAREDIAYVLGATRSEIIFTGSGTESDNFALRGIFDASQNKKVLITSSIEHPAVIETANYLEKQGIKVIYIPVDEFGMINLEFLENANSLKMRSPLKQD
jgi:cysteine desulfurase